MAGNSAGASDGRSGHKDPAWKYSTLADPTNRVNFVCSFCNRVIKGGVYRVKQHLVGGFRAVTECSQCPPHVRVEIQEFMSKKAEVARAEEQSWQRTPEIADFDLYGDDEEDEIGEQVTGVGRNRMQSSSSQNSSKFVSKKPRQKGPMDMYYTPRPEKVVQDRREGKMKQTAINEACKKQLRDRACTEIARWFYDAGIPFNAAKMESFAIAMEAVGQYGSGIKPPSYHELRVPLLKKEVDNTKELLQSHKEEWAKYGCSILSDGWRDSVSNREIVNFLVNSPQGSVFIKSIDVSNYVKNANRMYQLLDEMVEEIGAQNVVQVITDNASNYVAAGK